MATKTKAATPAPRGRPMWPPRPGSTVVLPPDAYPRVLCHNGDSLPEALVTRTVATPEEAAAIGAEWVLVWDLPFETEPAQPPPDTVPVVVGMLPDKATIGVPSFTLHIYGTGFALDAVIVFNGFDEPTTVVSSQEVTTGVNMNVWTNPSLPLPVAVRSGGVLSNEVTFTFEAAASAPAA
jgi:hypothetical protein